LGTHAFSAYPGVARNQQRDPAPRVTPAGGHVLGHLATCTPRVLIGARPPSSFSDIASRRGQKKTPAIPEKGRGLRQIS
jgi:hypothetical protein